MILFHADDVNQWPNVTLPYVYLSSQSIHTKKVNHGPSIRLTSFFPHGKASYSDDANHRHLEASAAKKVTDLLINQVIC